MLEENLGVKIDYATMDFGTYQDRLATDPPRHLEHLLGRRLPGPQRLPRRPARDRLDRERGRLVERRLRRRRSPTPGRPRDPGTATAAYARALSGSSATRRPPCRSSYGTSWSLVRDGLLGATQNGTGILRLAGLAWGPAMTATADRPCGPSAAVLADRRSSAACCSRSSPPRRCRPRTRHVRHAGRDPDLRQVDRVHRRRDVRAPIARVELRLEFPDALGPVIVDVPVEQGTGTTRCATSSTSRGGGHLVPNTTIVATWAAFTAIGATPVLAPGQTVRYEDTTHDWKTLKGDLMTVHWYEGGQAFASKALGIGEQAIKDTATLLGVTENEPVDFFIYGDEASFRDGARARDAGERRRPGPRRHPDAVRADHARRDRRRRGWGS